MVRCPAVTGDWVFRHAGGCLIEVPPLHLPAPHARCYLASWVATWWPDAASVSGWSQCRWAEAERGWELPRHLAVGDVLEFGLAMVSVAVGTVVAGCDLRWYGWLRYATDLALVVHGPYMDPTSAANAAMLTIAELRFAQLPGLAVDPEWVADDLGDVTTEP